MKKCHICNMVIQDDAKRCPRCNSSLQSIPKCGSCKGCSFKGLCSK